MSPFLAATFLPSALLGTFILGPGPTPESGLPSSTPDMLFASPTRLDHAGRIVAPVMIDGKGPFRFIIDTGASSSTISPQLATTLGLTPAGQTTTGQTTISQSQRMTGQRTMIVNGITGTQAVPSVSIGRLEAGDLVIQEMQLPVIWAPLMAGADGILGIAGFREESLFVDFRRNRVVISRSMRASNRVGYDKVPAKVLEGGLMAVKGRVGGVAVTAIIDTGSERSLGNAALQSALYAKRDNGNVERTAVYGATPDIASGEVRMVPTINLGPVNLSKVTVVFGDFHIFEVWDLLDHPAVIIGMDVLGTVDSLGIDYRRSEIYFETVERARDPNFDQSAMRWRAR
jgi:predicted aspartyl protease